MNDGSYIVTEVACFDAERTEMMIFCLSRAGDDDVDDSGVCGVRGRHKAVIGRAQVDVLYRQARQRARERSQKVILIQHVHCEAATRLAI